MASDLVKMLFSKSGTTYHPEKSLTPFRKKSLCLPWQELDLSEEKLKKIVETELPKTYEDLILRRLGIWNLEEHPEVKNLIQEHSSYLSQYLS